MGQIVDNNFNNSYEMSVVRCLKRKFALRMCFVSFSCTHHLSRPQKSQLKCYESSGDQVRSSIALVHCVNYGQFRRNAFHLLMILIKSGVCRLAREHKAWHFSH